MPSKYAYDTAHKKVRRERGPARDHECVECGDAAEHWAYNHEGGKNHRVGRVKGSVLTFSVDPADYLAMCRYCHKAFDEDHYLTLGELGVWDTTERQWTQGTQWGRSQG